MIEVVTLSVLVVLCLQLLALALIFTEAWGNVPCLRIEPIILIHLLEALSRCSLGDGYTHESLVPKTFSLHSQELRSGHLEGTQHSSRCQSSVNFP